MTYRLLFFLLALLIVCNAGPAQAGLSQEESEHARSAFLFAERENWDDARQHAKKTGEPSIVKLMSWEYLLDNDSGAKFSEITAFLRENPDWPEQKKLRLRAEQSLRDNQTADKEILAWFGSDTPISGIGKIALAGALQRSGASPEKITPLVRGAWVDGDFEEAEEKTLLASYDRLLRKEDDINRTSRLLWEEKTGPAKRMLPRLSEDQQKLSKARMALIDNKKLAVLAVAQVSSSLKNDPGLMYDRMRFRARRGDDKGVRAILLATPASIPYPERWWKYREQQIREAIDEKNYAMANNLLAHHAQQDGQELADAIWLKGWLELNFLKTPKVAYETFYAMYSRVHYPVSKARAAYWAATAAAQSKDETAASNWYNTASAFPTTFYGQLGALKQYGAAPLHIPAAPQIGIMARSHFEGLELVRAIQFCAQFDAPETASRLISYLIETSDNDETTALAAELGKKINLEYLSVRGAKKALQQRNVVLLETGYPVPKISETLDIEKPLAFAIARQESEYDPFAKSSSGALGLMQLRPSTAKEIARKEHIDYRHDRIFDVNYNMNLGSHYLSRLIENYDGSYVMAIAAYNAGPGNVHKWAKQFGTPANSVEGAIEWIEKIPFYETRNYVQRVIENLEVYRHIEADGNSPKLQIGDDLVR